MDATCLRQPIRDTAAGSGVNGHPGRAETSVATHGGCSCGHALTARLLADIGKDLGAYEGAAVTGVGARCPCSRYTPPVGQFGFSEVDEELPWRAA
jgi:hypothetical protein